jgi:hypothetical protein
MYPGSTPEFRIFVKQDGTQEFQVRYVCESQGYKSKWQLVKIERENNVNNTKA